MIKQLEEQIISATKRQETIAGMIDVTKQMQIAFNSADWNIIRARLRPTPDDPLCIMVIGFRSDMLMSFEQSRVRPRGEYLPCDIPGLVPGLASVVAHQGKGLVGNAVVRGDQTRLVLVFEGRKKNRFGATRALATGIYRFFKTWRDWTRVLLSTIDSDPVIGEWSLDWREFLAGESGLITMPWFTPMTYAERYIALERIILASKALITSVLSEKQADDPMIRYMDKWLTHLRPLAQIFYETDESEGVRV